MANEKKTCCTCRRALLFVVLLGVAGAAGVLIWQFLPEDTINDLKGIFPNSTDDASDTTGDDGGNGSTGEGGGGGGQIDNDGSSTTTPTGYQYFQCSDNNLDNCCNGLDTPGVCDLRLDEMLFATAHNAMATEAGGFPNLIVTGPNHKLPLEDALEAGYRGLSIDVCNCNGILELCHGVCNLGSRDPTEVFTNIVGFLQDHPTEFLMLNIQLSNEARGGSAVNLQDLYDLMMSVDGFYDMVYVETDRQTDLEWPTLGSLLHGNDQEPKKQIVMFQFNGPTCSDNEPCPEGLHFWFNYGAESEFNFPTKQDIEDISTSCKVTRGNPVESRGFLGISNFVSPPDEDTAKEINTREFIEKRLEDCSTFNNNMDINALLIDFWSIGDLLEVTQEHNKKLGAAKQRRRRAATTTTKSALRSPNKSN